MPIQWGPNTKRVADLGLNECDFCHEWALFALCSRSTEVRLMFLVPLVKTPPKHFLFCERCGHETPLPETRVALMLDEVRTLPSNALFVEMWNKFDSSVADWAKSRPVPQLSEVNPEDGLYGHMLNVLVEEMSRLYSVAHLREVADRYLEFSRSEFEKAARK
jgi:hypothetical protein